MSPRNPRRLRMKPVDAMPTSDDELSILVQLSKGLIITLTGPAFPRLAPKDAARVLMFVPSGCRRVSDSGRFISRPISC